MVLSSSGLTSINVWRHMPTSTRRSSWQWSARRLPTGRFAQLLNYIKIICAWPGANRPGRTVITSTQSYGRHSLDAQTVRIPPSEEGAKQWWACHSENSERFEFTRNHCAFDDAHFFLSAKHRSPVDEHVMSYSDSQYASSFSLSIRYCCGWYEEKPRANRPPSYKVKFCTCWRSSPPDNRR